MRQGLASTYLKYEHNEYPSLRKLKNNDGSIQVRTEISIINEGHLYDLSLINLRHESLFSTCSF